MKDIINYYYNFDVFKTNDYKNYSSFNYLNDEFYLVFYNRDEKELNDLVQIITEMKNKNIKVHEIVLNRENKILTKVNNNYYILLKINDDKNRIIDFINIINFNNKLRLKNNNIKINRINWAYLWSNKIDYFEYQIKEIGKDKNIILDSFSYYVGLAENAISYVNNTNKRNIKKDVFICLSHRRIHYPNIVLNYYNPLSFIFDMEVRDVAEYLKIEFFHNKDSLKDLILYLRMQNLSEYEYNMLYARLLYPSYYFDLYEDVMNNGNENEKALLNILSKAREYELFLKKAYFEIHKYAFIEPIDWIMKEN